MPSFKLNKDQVVPTKGGHFIQFKKGVATHVPEHVMQDVIAVGAQPTEEIEEKPEADNPEPADPKKRKDKILDAMTKLVKRGKRDDFTANGMPSMSALHDQLGFSIDAHERNDLWLEHQKPAA